MSKGVAGIRFGGAGSNGTVTGTGTTNRFAIWTSSTAIGDSSWENSSGHFRPITDNTYDIGGSSNYVRAVYSNQVDYSTTMVFTKSSVESVRIDSAGKVGINTGALTIGQLSTKGSGNTSATYSFSAVNSSGTVSVLIRDDTKMSVGTSTFTEPGGGEADFVVGGVNGELSKLFKFGNRLTFSHDGNIGIFSVGNSGSPVNFGSYSNTEVAILLNNTEIARFDSGAMNIGAVGNTNAKAIFELVSTTKGFLPPRMTTTQRDAITSPPAGLIIYNTSTNKLNLYTTAWEVVTSA